MDICVFRCTEFQPHPYHQDPLPPTNTHTKSPPPPLLLIITLAPCNQQTLKLEPEAFRSNSFQEVSG